jgi:hypothetical protein
MVHHVKMGLIPVLPLPVQGTYNNGVFNIDLYVKDNNLKDRNAKLVRFWNLDI